MSDLALYGDSISGNCLKVKFVCDRLQIPYRWIETSVLKGENRTAEFVTMNPMGQVPVIVKDDRALAQSNAIMLYLAEGSDLIPADAFQRAQMMQWLFWEQYSHETVIAVRRFHKTYLKKPDSEIDPTLLPRGEKVLAVMDGHLAKHRWFVSDSLTLTDIGLVAYTRFAHEGGFTLPSQVAQWVRRTEDELKISHAA